MYKLIATFALLLGGIWALGGTSDTLASADHDPLDAVRPAVIEADGLDGFALPEGLAGLDGLTILRAIAKHHQCDTGFLTEGVLDANA